MAPFGIRVNAICPGWIDTPLLTPMDPMLIAGIVMQIPKGRLGKAEELAELVRFLVRPREQLLQRRHLRRVRRIRLMPTIFTRIINGDIPGTFVYRDPQCVAFLSINPLAHGHTLVVPVAEVDHWVDMPHELATHLFAVAHRIGRAQRSAFGCERVGLIIAGYEVPHAHIHLIPTSNMSQLDFANAAASAERADLEAAAHAIRVGMEQRS